MDSAPVYTSLNVPTLITSPSPNCIQWSQDGQVFFTSKSAIFVMTAELGINFDANSVLRDSIDEEREDRPSLGWFRTMIQFDKTDACRWTDYSQDWSATSLGSMDITVWTMALSPSQITQDASCILAVLSSNMDLTLWVAGKNGLKGEWKKLSNVTGVLLDTLIRDQSISRTTATISAQILCMDWTSQPTFSCVPALETDASFLVCGNRAGDLIFLRRVHPAGFHIDISSRFRYSYDEQTESKIKIESKLKVSEKWVLQVAVSPWIPSRPMTCIALVAYSTPDGTVGLVRVTRALRSAAKSSPFGIPFALFTEFEQLQTSIADPRRAALTALKWIEIPGRSPVLAYGKPGTIHFWSDPSSSPGQSWSGLHTLQLKTQKRSIGSSFLQPLSGIQYVLPQDALVLSLVDGSFHVIHGLAGEGPRLVNSENESGGKLNSETLSTIARGVFSRVERGSVTFADVMRTSGMVMYDDGFGSLIWIHEVTRPADFSYKHDAKHNSMFTVARLWHDASDESILQALVKVFGNSKIGPAPLYYLRPILFHLRHYSVIARLHLELIKILALPKSEQGSPEEEDHTLDIHLETWSMAEGQAQIDPATRQDLRNSLKRHLFGHDKFFMLRMRLSVADFVWKLSTDDPQKQADYGLVAQALLSAISHRNLRTLIRHLIAVAEAFTFDDIPFVLRLVVQSRLSSTPANLSAEGSKLAEIARRVIPMDEHSTHLDEQCPACGVNVPLEDIINAVCANGHTWARCSVTTFILSTAQVRTCIGCTRKAFLPFSSRAGGGGGDEEREFLPPAVRKSWFVEELLEANERTYQLEIIHEDMATWRNGSAFGFDCRPYQKVAGSSPAVVMNKPAHHVFTQTWVTSNVNRSFS
ncbi:hypothetical protein D9757_004058 [Collybiopsis confluens]|uniref:Transcription factor IIIC 90kDa subunit N-terminal domain-containing protein n=1 Tax=Collybiopsis confluens TaxID=2823264 RepID=A0A8H5HWM4_9AGAR|nr:hypothetical protein D9757_004058 [Collybiopsis confluens]